jgi:ankyrin repeat protein
LNTLVNNKLTPAILDDDLGSAKRLLRADAGLATSPFQKPTLYNFHWIYVGDTPLHLAAAGYRVEIVRLLLEFGADPNAAKNMRKSSPLHYAADGCLASQAWKPKRQVETLRSLLDHGANIHLQDMNGATPLHRAVRTRSADAVKFLLESGADPTIKNKPGSTPFHLAVQNTGRGGSGEPAAINAQQEIIKAFLSFGLSPSLKNSNGKTVTDSARSGWIREMLTA